MQQPLFGEWLKDRRKKLDLTQAELAQRAGCSVPALRKIESGERKPSKQLAGLLAQSLEIPSEDQTTFIKVARGELNVERLYPSAHPTHVGIETAPKTHLSSGNLPGMLTPFFGREPELAATGQLLRDPQCRLLTVTGPGGIGKTRLTIEVVDHHKDIFPDGIWFVPLAPLNSSEFLISAIADAMNFGFQDPVNPRDQLLGYLRDKRALLILDNAEHLLDGIGLFTEILENSPQVKLLVTSRERLNLHSEWVFEIQGLPVPDSDQVELFEGYSSVAIFLQAARRTRADFKLREPERWWVMRICQIMDGMPLGIELAAAWVGMLSCEEIAREIEHNIDFLTVAMRDLPERHRSLRATLDHSWNLLNSEEKAVLSRLSVFQGSFRRDAAESICGANLSVLSSLKDKSLLRRTDQGYYDLHELIRQYTALQLAEDAREEGQVKDRHAIYYAERLRDWEIALKSSRQVETLNEMALEIDNLRQAWQRMAICCEVDCHRITLLSQNLFRSSLFSLSLFLELRCRYWEAVNLFGQAVETLKAAKELASECGEIQYIDSMLGLVTAYLGHHQYLMHYLQAHESLEEALRLLENDSSQAEKAQAQIMLAWIYQAQGQYQKAADLFKKSSIVFQRERDDWWYTLSISMLAMVTLGLGNINEGVMLFQECLSRIEAGDLRLGAHVRTGLGYAYISQGDYSEAKRLLQESLAMSYKLGDKRQAAFNYRLLGQVAMVLGHNEQAKNYFQECVTLLGEYGESPDLATGLAYLGKSLIASQEPEPARREFQKVIQIGLALDIFPLTYWGLINLARVLLEENQPKRAYEMALVLEGYSVDSKVVRDDYAQLLAELQARLTPQQIQAAINKTEGSSIEALLDLI